MPGPKNNMEFQHTYVSKEKMQAQDPGVFSSTFKSYVTDGAKEVFKEADRELVMGQVRTSLRAKMSEANNSSESAAKEMQSKHKDLREAMRKSLAAAKEATRRRKLMEAQLLAAKGKQSNENAEAADVRIQDMIDERDTLKQTFTEEQFAADETLKEKVAEADRLRGNDVVFLDNLHKQNEQNKKVTHHKNLFSLFRAIDKAIERKAIESSIADQDAIIEREQESLKTKAREWNEKRKNYRAKTFREYYNTFDSAAATFRAVNRGGVDKGDVPEKKVMEYVGDFDIGALNTTLEALKTNPYLIDDIQVKDRKGKKFDPNDENALLKTHTKMSLYGEADENGFRTRYKLGKKWEGYTAKNQFGITDQTALDAFKKANAEQKVKTISADAMKLQVDERDITGEYLNSQDNLEIIQAKQDKWYGAKTVKGIFINNEFISTNYSLVKSKKDAKTIGLTNSWSKYTEKEQLRRAVLKSQIFNQINCKTIQYAMGYEAGRTLNKVKDSLINQISRSIRSEAGLMNWDTTNNDLKVDEEAAKKSIKEEDKKDLKEDAVKRLEDKAVDKAYKDKVKAILFNDEDEAALLKKKDPGAKLTLPNEMEAKWEETLAGDKQEDKDKIPAAVKVKVIYDVIRQEHANHAFEPASLKKTDTRAGKLIDAVKDDFKVLQDISLLLLGHDNKPEYWNIAKYICTEIRLTNFEKKYKATFDSRFTRAIAKAGADQGMLMRIALIDELNANRTHLDPDNFLNALMPTRWKQFSEDIAGKRGISATFQQKFTDGSILSFISDVFTSYVDIVDGMETFSKDTIRDLKIIDTYSTALTSAMNCGAITEVGAYAISDMFGDEMFKKEVDGKLKDAHTSDERRNQIGLIFNAVQTMIKLVKQFRAWKKKRTQEIEQKAKKEPNYNPKNDLAYVDTAWHDFILSVSNTVLGISATVAKFFGTEASKQVKSILGMAKSILNVYEDSVRFTQATLNICRINDTEKSILEMQKDRTGVNAELLEVLEKNSQLQYGLSCAKRKNKQEQAGRVVSWITNAGKAVINAVKAFFPEGKKNPVFIVVDAIWGTVTTAAKTVVQIVGDKVAVKENIEKMLGKGFGKYNKGLLAQVLRREVGIVSPDYLTDLARIFMSMDTHVFMKDAAKGKNEAEKKVGALIMTTLFNNTAYLDGKFDKADFNKLMGVMGVKGNFHKILKHSLA